MLTASARGRTARIETKDTTNDAALMSSAHSTPKVNSSGAASGGPMIAAKLPVDWNRLLARGMSGASTTDPSSANRAGLKNWAKQLAATITA